MLRWIFNGKIWQITVCLGGGSVGPSIESCSVDCEFGRCFYRLDWVQWRKPWLTPACGTLRFRGTPVEDHYNKRSSMVDRNGVTLPSQPNRDFSSLTNLTGCPSGLYSSVSRTAASIGSLDRRTKDRRKGFRLCIYARLRCLPESLTHHRTHDVCRYNVHAQIILRNINVMEEC
jgi:hypothetical protein